MTVLTSIPASTRRPGRFFEFNIAAAQRGLVPLTRRIALVGAISGSATMTALTPTQAFSEADCDTLCGRGSELALMGKWAFKAAREYGKSAEVWLVGIADPAGTANTNTLTVSGTATAAGNVQMRIAGRPVVVGVDNGDAATDVAAALEAVIDELAADLPCTAAVASAVVTCTHVNTGVNGNDTEYDVDSTPTGISIAVAQTFAGVGAIDITAALDVLVDKDYDIIACSNHTSTDITDFAAHLTSMWDPATKRFRQTILAERSTLGTAQTLATAADDFKQHVISAEGFRNTCGELAAYVGMVLAAEDDLALPFNDLEMPSVYLPDSADIPTGAELESGIAGGLLMLSANDKKTQARIIRAVTTKVTHSSVPFYAMLDTTITKVLIGVARQIDIKYALAFPRAKKTERTRKAVRSVILDALKAMESPEIEWVQNVDDHADEIEVETDSVVTSRLNAGIPASVIPPLNQIANVINLILE